MDNTTTASFAICSRWNFLLQTSNSCKKHRSFCNSRERSFCTSFSSNHPHLRNCKLTLWPSTSPSLLTISPWLTADSMCKISFVFSVLGIKPHGLVSQGGAVCCWATWPIQHQYFFAGEGADCETRSCLAGYVFTMWCKLVLLFVCFVLWDKVSLHSPGYPGTHYAHQVVLDLEIHLPLIKGNGHHHSGRS